MDITEKKAVVKQLLAAKTASGLTNTQLGEKLGLSNVYVGQLFRRQAELKPGTVSKLKSLVPGLDDKMLAEMQKPPLRSYDADIIQEPNTYRLVEVCYHYGETILEIIQEEFGDGIMSAIDYVITVDKVKGSKGEDRVKITCNGKYLAHIEQPPAP
jgi:cyanate lyase